MGTVASYTEQLYSRYVWIAFREDSHVSMEDQSILIKFQVIKTLSIQTNIIEKKEINA